MQLQKNYKTSLAAGIRIDWNEHEFILNTEPNSDRGYIFIAPGTTDEEECFYHRRVGTSVFVYEVNRWTSTYHGIWTQVFLASSVSYFNHILSKIGDAFLLYKKDVSNVYMTWGDISINWDVHSIPDLDTSLWLSDRILISNDTNYIYLYNYNWFISTGDLLAEDGYIKLWEVITDISWLITSYRRYEFASLPIPWKDWQQGIQGIQWPQWIQGPQWEPWVLSPSELSYVHTQSVSSAIWTINHNLGFYPNVQVEDSSWDSVIWQKIIQNSVNQMIIEFQWSMAGKAYLS